MENGFKIRKKDRPNGSIQHSRYNGEEPLMKQPKMRSGLLSAGTRVSAQNHADPETRASWMVMANNPDLKGFIVHNFSRLMDIKNAQKVFKFFTDYRRWKGLADFDVVKILACDPFHVQGFYHLDKFRRTLRKQTGWFSGEPILARDGTVVEEAPFQTQATKTVNIKIGWEDIGIPQWVLQEFKPALRFNISYLSSKNAVEIKSGLVAKGGNLHLNNWHKDGAVVVEGEETEICDISSAHRKVTRTSIESEQKMSLGDGLFLQVTYYNSQDYFSAAINLSLQFLYCMDKYNLESAKQQTVNGRMPESNGKRTVRGTASSN